MRDKSKQQTKFSAFLVCGFLLTVLLPKLALTAPLPRVMVLIEEKNLGTYSLSEAERVITQTLLDQGIEVVDADFVKSSTSRDKLLHAATGGPNAAAALGLRFGAEVIVVGEAYAKGGATTVRDSDMRSFSANVSLKAIKTNTASVIATSTQTSSNMHVDDITGGSVAIRSATTQSFADLWPQVQSRYGGSADRPSAVRILVSNIDQLWQLAAVKDIFRSTQGVVEVVQRSYVAGVAEFDITLRGEASRLAEDLTLASPGYFKLRVLGISAQKLDVQLVNI